MTDNTQQYPPPGSYFQPGSYPQPGGYPQSGGYSQPGGYPQPIGYPQPGGYPMQPGYGGGYAPPPPFQSDYVPNAKSVSQEPQPNYGSSDLEEQKVKQFNFSEESVRKGFIKKVYSILMCQLLVTLTFICWFVYHTSTRRWVHNHPEMFWIAFVLTFVILIAMMCFDVSIRRKFPLNLIFLTVFTVGESFLLATISIYYYPEDVVMAVGITAAICFALTLFAFQTKWDFTVLRGALFVGLIILIVFAILAIFIRGKTMQLIHGSLGAFIFSIYLIYDTQLMMGGKHKYSISPEEYIFAALNLYLDIVQIFIYILKIIGALRRE